VAPTNASSTTHAQSDHHLRPTSSCSSSRRARAGTMSAGDDRAPRWMMTPDEHHAPRARPMRSTAIAARADEARRARCSSALFWMYVAGRKIVVSTVTPGRPLLTSAMASSNPWSPQGWVSAPGKAFSDDHDQAGPVAHHRVAAQTPGGLWTMVATWPSRMSLPPFRVLDGNQAPGRSRCGWAATWLHGQTLVRLCRRARRLPVTMPPGMREETSTVHRPRC